MVEITSQSAFRGRTLRVFGALAAVALGASLSAVPIANPNFDFPGVTHKDYLTYDTGFNQPAPDFGWTLVSGTIEHIGSYWKGYGGWGDQSIDLNGNDTGHIAQNVYLEPGRYEVKFALSGNPDGGDVKDVRVSLGSMFEDFTFNSAGRSHAEMGWVLERAQFLVNQAGTYSLSFQSLTTGMWGPAIDRVSLNEVQVPESLGQFGVVSLAAFTLISGVWYRKAGLREQQANRN